MFAFASRRVRHALSGAHVSPPAPMVWPGSDMNFPEPIDPDARRHGRDFWSAMLRFIPDNRGPLRILDFGCGSGFATRRCLEHLKPAQVESLVCYDPRPYLLAETEASLHTPCLVEFVDTLPAAMRRGPYEVLLTHSVLSQFGNLGTSLQVGLDLLQPGGVWLTSYATSARFNHDVDDPDTLARRFRGKWKLQWCQAYSLPTANPGVDAFPCSETQLACVWQKTGEARQ